MVMVDFQLVRRGGPIAVLLDIAFLFVISFCTCAMIRRSQAVVIHAHYNACTWGWCVLMSADTATEHRVQREQRLLSLYHSTLLSTGIQNFSFDDCILAYRKVHGNRDSRIPFL